MYIYLCMYIYIYIYSAANKYYSSTDHHEQKNEKSIGQIKFSVVTIKYKSRHRRGSIKQAFL